MVYRQNAGGSKGFSLFEIMVALAVAAVLITLAVPALGNMLAKQRLNGAQTELLSALRFAQNEALARGQSVIIVKGADDNERIIQVEDGGEILRHINIDPRLQVVPSANVAANADQAIRFMSTGNAFNGGLAVCAPHLSGENSIDIFFWAAQLESQRREAGNGCSAPHNCINPDYQWWDAKKQQYVKC